MHTWYFDFKHRDFPEEQKELSEEQKAIHFDLRKSIFNHRELPGRQKDFPDEQKELPERQKAIHFDQEISIYYETIHETVSKIEILNLSIF
jgi:hypothetical protein